MKKLGIIGGGAAGFFLAANLPSGIDCTLIEKAQSPMQKVKISGGGRCNVTHACFDPRELVTFYPRGKKELLSVFYAFQPADTMQWFQERGVELKIEDDQRVFPVSNNSMDIVKCLWQNAVDSGVNIKLGHTVKEIKQNASKGFEVITTQGNFEFDALVIATGSSNQMWNLIEKDLGHPTISRVPSLFTFNIPHKPLNELMGISLPHAKLVLPELNLEDEGPLLITHWGLSGPAVLRISAYGARELASVKYNTPLIVNWLGENTDTVFAILQDFKSTNSQSSISKKIPFQLSKRFWLFILSELQIKNKNWQAFNKKQLHDLALKLTQSTYQIKGKSTFKEEFVTAGGVDLKDINFKTMESKLIPNLYFAGETLNIDAVTGGFNFQACWSEAYLISEALKEKFLNN